MSTARALVLRTFQSGTPDLHLEPRDLDQPAAGQVRVRMLYAPIHPADWNVLQGTYGRLPELPAVPGNEGCGIVEAAGDGVSCVTVGDLVSVAEPGNWCSHRVVGESSVVKLPGDLDPRQAAMIFINPFTAWAMLHINGRPEAGRPVVQNASNSAVGRAVIQIARQLDVPTVNLVRRPEVIDALRRDGADVVFDDENKLAEWIRDQKIRPMLGLNAVGGASALALANTLADGGTLVTYGAMARQPLKIPNGLLIFRDLCFRGFWLRNWLSQTSRDDQDTALEQIAQWVLEGKVTQPVDRVFPMDEFSQALAAAAADRRDGKILFDLSSGT